MSNYMGTIVDCIQGDDENGNIFKTLEYALDKLKTKGTIMILPGTYSGVDLESVENIFEYSIIGTGSDVDIHSINHEGKINSTYKSVKLRGVTIKGNKNILDFKDVELSGGYSLNCEKTGDDEETEINFIDCVFGIGYQVLLKNGNYNIIFRNCIFRGKRRTPIIISKHSHVMLKVSLCDFDVPLIYNDKSSVYIHYSNCNFTNLWTGKECSCFTSQEELIRNETRTLVLVQDENSSSGNKVRKTSGRVKTINTNEFSKVEIPNFIEFVCFKGRYPINVDLPDDVNIGHKIEIYKDCPYIIISNIEYYGKIIKVRMLEDGWFIYNYSEI